MDKDKMGIENFFKLSSKFVSATIQAHAEGVSHIEERYGVAYDYQLVAAEYEGFNFPIIFKQESGKRQDDMLDTGTAVLFLISDRMKSVLEENHLTGWKTFPIKLLDKKGGEIKGYQGLSITGRCGPIDYSKCEIIEKRLVPTGPLGKYYRGYHIGLDKWDGSDFFLPEKYCGIIVPAKVVEILKKNKLTNIRFRNLADIESPDYGLPKEWKERLGIK